MVGATAASAWVSLKEMDIHPLSLRKSAGSTMGIPHSPPLFCSWFLILHLHCWFHPTLVSSSSSPLPSPAFPLPAPAFPMPFSCPENRLHCPGRSAYYWVTACCSPSGALAQRWWEGFMVCLQHPEVELAQIGSGSYSA